jgi:hypothetical protein
MCSKHNARRLLSGAAIGLLGLLLIAGEAPATDAPETRWITLRWTQAGSVAGFKVYTRLVMRSYSDGKNIGLPKPENGVYSHQIEVSNRDANYVGLRSFNSRGELSDFSNSVLYLLPPN